MTMGLRLGDPVLLLARREGEQTYTFALVHAMPMDQEQLGLLGEGAVSVMRVELVGGEGIVEPVDNVPHCTSQAWLSGVAPYAYEELPLWPIPGVCRYCGCTWRRACNPPCWWVDKMETVCSAKSCVEKWEAAAVRGVPA